MRHAASLATAACVAALAACAQGPEPIAAASTVPAAALGAGWSAGADDGMGWFFLPDDGPRLAYGPPNSAAALMITCAGSGGLTLAATSAERRGSDLTLRSGAAATTLPVSNEADPVSGGYTMTVRTTVSDPVIAGFRRSGQLSAAAPLNAGPSDAPAVEQFFRACG